jgi:GTP-binding protein
MLIDDVTITVRAGKGGDGIVSFNKAKMALGPTGGSGGAGGSVYCEGISNLDALKQFRFRKDLQAYDGHDGKIRLNDGATGKDLVLKVPVGTVIHDLTYGRTREIVRVGERVLVARGGRGGRGNFLFRSSVNTTPKEFEYGAPGDKADLRLELKLIADVGFIGFPNAGKSSILNELTNASVKVANYPFTTLEPNLGVYSDLILADIPGLIEEASSGKGLGTKFLRHIERTRVLCHLISAESADPAKDYRVIREELGKHNRALLAKREYVLLSKSDMASASALKEKLASLKKINPSVLAVSIYDSESLKDLEKILHLLMKEKRMADRH